MGQKRLDRLVQLLIPPSLVLLMVVTIFELFYDLSLGWKFAIDLFDVYVVIIFAIDLYYRWQETQHLGTYLKKHWLDIIATIPFGLIFLWIDGLALLQGLRGVRLVKEVAVAARLSRTARVARYGRFLRLLRFGARAPRFIRSRKQIKTGKVRRIQKHEEQLKGTLSFKVILLVTINSIMGTGIWFLTAAGAKYAGPASLISWGVLSLISIYIAMCFAELTAMFPKAGGVYEFAKQTYGRFWSFVIGWTTSIAGSVTIAMLLLGALQYMVPAQYAAWYVPIAIGLLVLFNYVAYRGMQTSTFMLVSFAVVTLVTVVAVLVPGFFNISVDNLTPFFVFPSFTIILTIFFIAETFFGWESAIFLSAETKNPTKVMPKALVYGTIIIAILAFLLSFIGMGIIPWDQFGTSAAPLKDIGSALFGTTGGIIFTILVFVSIIGAVASWIVTAPRLLMAIAEDKLFFVQFAKIHPKHKSPYVSIVFQTLLISLLVYIGSGQYETLLHMLIPLILVVYSAVLLGVVVLRFKRPNAKRPYKVVFGKLGPFITVGFMLFLLVMFIKETHGALDVLRISASLIIFGVPAYFFIELFYDEKYTRLRRRVLAWWYQYANKSPVIALTHRRILRQLEPFNSRKKLMLVNFPLGSLTQRILAKKMKYGSIIVVNQTKEETQRLRKNHSKTRKVTITTSKKRGTLPGKNKINTFASYNDIGYVENIGKYLQTIKKRMEKNGRVCFYVVNHFLSMKPNAVELENKSEILKTFKKAGFSATYKKHRMIWKTEIIISAKKK